MLLPVKPSFLEEPKLTHQHSVLVRVPGVLDDGHDVHALLGHVDEIAAGAVRELHCVDHALLQMEHVLSKPNYGMQGGPSGRGTLFVDIKLQGDTSGGEPGFVDFDLGCSTILLGQ